MANHKEPRSGHARLTPSQGLEDYCAILYVITIIRIQAMEQRHYATRTCAITSDSEIDLHLINIIDYNTIVYRVINLLPTLP